MPDRKGADAAGDRRAEMQRRMEHIGDRFVQRLLTELATMRELLADLRAGDFSGVRDLELFAHRIHGSSAMFGFTDVSRLAGELEQLVSHVEPAAVLEDDLARIEQQFGLLETAGRAANQARTGD